MNVAVNFNDRTCLHASGILCPELLRDRIKFVERCDSVEIDNVGNPLVASCVMYVPISRATHRREPKHGYVYFRTTSNSYTHYN